MPGVIATSNHPKLLWPGIFETWGQVYDQHPREYTDLFEIKSSEKAYEQMVQVTPFGLAPVKAQSAGITYDSEMQGAVTTATMVAYALGYIATHEEIKDNLYKEVATRRAQANAFSMTQTVETVGAFLYNNAFVTTYFTTGDGVALCSSAHVNASGGTFSNILSPGAALSEAALEAANIQIMDMRDDRGNYISVMPRSLHVSKDTWFNANRILNSVLQPNSSNNNINVLRATNAIPEGIKLNHYFTVANAWFLRTNVPRGMLFFWREEPSFAQDNDFGTKNAMAASYMRFAPTCEDPRGIFGVNGP